MQLFRVGVVAEELGDELLLIITHGTVAFELLYIFTLGDVLHIPTGTAATFNVTDLDDDLWHLHEPLLKFQHIAEVDFAVGTHRVLHAAHTQTVERCEIDIRIACDYVRHDGHLDHQFE